MRLFFQLSIEDVKFNTAWISGADVRNFFIRRNTWPIEDGISFDETASASMPMSGIIEDNVITEGRIDIQSRLTNPGDSVAILNNRINGPGGFRAIFVDNQFGCVIRGNRVADNGGTGINVGRSQDCMIADNVVHRSALHGIQLSSAVGTKVFNNISNRNGQSGDPAAGCGISLESSSHNHLDGNVTQLNALCGMRFSFNSSQNTFGRNISRGNAANPAGSACANAAPNNCSAPYGAGFTAPNLCDDGPGTTSLCDNLMPGPPRS